MNSQTEIYSHRSEYNDINVTDHGFIRVLSFTHNRQSSMYLDAPFDTDFEYPSYLHLTLAIKPDAARTLAIGLGGGTVVKRMWRDYPEMRIDAVELDSEVVEVARRYFSLPDDERVRIFVDDGRRFLETHPDVYDIVIVDAFDDDVVPPALTADDFMPVLRERMARDGVLAYNFMGVVEGEGSGPFRALHETLSSAWRQVRVFVVDEGVRSRVNNLILLATDAELTVDELKARIADRVGGLVSVPAFQLFGAALYDGELE